MMSNNNRSFPGSAGWTAMQLVVAICVIMILSAITARPLGGLIRRIHLQNAADGMKHFILNARMRAVSSPDRHCGVAFRFHAANSPLDDSLFAFLDANPPDNNYVAGVDQLYLSAYVIPRKQGITATMAVPAGLTGEVLFRGDGSATSSVTVALALKGFLDTVDVLASTGRVKVSKH